MSLAAWLPDAPWYVLVAIPFVIVTAYTVFGATGFGSSIITVPLLAHWFPLTFAVPLVTALDCVSTANASLRQWRHADRREIGRLLPTVLVGHRARHDAARQPAARPRLAGARGVRRGLRYLRPRRPARMEGGPAVLGVAARPLRRRVQRHVRHRRTVLHDLSLGAHPRQDRVARHVVDPGDDQRIHPDRRVPRHRAAAERAGARRRRAAAAADVRAATLPAIACTSRCRDPAC